MKINFLMALLILSGSVIAQADKRVLAVGITDYAYPDEYLGFLNGLKAENIGPTIMSGRVVDLEVDPADPSHFYAAFATGGLWETKNNGTSFTSIFNNQPTFGIGDIAVDWTTKKIFVGSGENNSSRSSYAGMGIFVSDNNGATWKHLGLEETHHIGRIVLNPSNPDEILVAAIGHLFTHNKERGIYKSSDGGKTWKQTLFINERTGVIDLVSDPQNSKILYAAAWERERVAWNFSESGEGSGIYKSTDGGETWNLISVKESNFPQGKGVGRIGLGVSYQNENVIYAFLDNQDHREKQAPSSSGDLTRDELRTMSKEDFLKMDVARLQKYLRDNEFPEKYTTTQVLEMVRADKIKPIALVEYLEDANSLLFDTPVKGAEVYRSDDGGKTWKKTHEGYLDNMVFTYGYYFGQIRIHPKNHDKIYLAAFYVATSNDGGKTFKNINSENVHVDHHALWINPDKEGHLVNGNDGGLNITYDDGQNWIKCVNPPVGQFYTVAVDNAENYNVYGGLQDNGVWYGPHHYQNSSSWVMEGKYPYQTLLGGDGMQVQVDPRDNTTVYTGWQFGSYFRINRLSGDQTPITPKHELGERPLRFNWQTPIHLSNHNPDVLYLAANKVYRSFNQGNKFKCISPDLTKGGKKGDVSFGTVSCIHESPIRFGLIYAGSDDGLVHVTKDGGANWENISSGLPENYWVRRVVASAHDEGRVYVCLSGHTMDDFQSFLFVSDDYGKNWKQLSNGLPYYPVNVIREDATNKNLLYVGTDGGLYISINEGKHFFPVKNGFPVVPVHDLAVQDRDADLVIATHGQSLFKLDLETLRNLPADKDKKITLMPIETVYASSRWGKEQKWYEDSGQEPSVNVFYYSDVPATTVEVTVTDPDGDVLFTDKFTSVKGVQRYPLKLVIPDETARTIDYKRRKKNMPSKFKEATDGKFYYSPQKYRVAFTVNGKKQEQIVEVRKRH